MAFEDWFLRHGHRPKKLIFIWSSRPCVILGRFQNPWAETSLSYLKKSNTLLVRRQSGGGCVYQDEGNINFTFFSKELNPNRKENLSLISNFLKTIKVKTHINERYDIVRQQGNKFYKISGSACKRTKDSSLHHCTLLVDSHLERLKQSLAPTLHISNGRAIPSVSSPVISLKKIDPSISRHLFLTGLKRYLNGIGIQEKPLFLGDQEKERLREKALFFSRFEWIFGETPSFECQDKSGRIKILSRKALVTKIQIGEDIWDIKDPLPLNGNSLASFFLSIDVEVDKNFLQQEIGLPFPGTIH